MNKNKIKEEFWKQIRFDKLVCCKVCQCDYGAGKKYWCACHRKQINKALSQALQQKDKEWVEKTKINIGMLRQWLNERTDNKLLTNEDLEVWILQEMEEK